MSLPFNRTSAQLKGNQSYPNKKILVSFVQVIDQGMGINCSLEWSSNVTDQILAQHLHYLHRIHKSDKSFHWRGKYFSFIRPFIRLSVHLSVHLPTLCVFVCHRSMNLNLQTTNPFSSKHWNINITRYRHFTIVYLFGITRLL